ncbi:MAG TPA: 50S ribosomal protein L6 [Candidatus Nanoarchaeia archaeon]|nr:large subunit ribosomal protein L6 [uncultured archaeon]HJX49965.1 50S ribosomal protein L6 [Candidatus Nanoarchaeia archaeon]
MRKEIIREIKIPEGVEATLKGSSLTVKGPEGENKRTFDTRKLIFELKDKKIVIGDKKATKKEKKRINTIASHIENMLVGVQEKFEYILKVVYSHFPITVEIKGNEAIIKNFLGEKIARKAKIPEGAEVKVNKEIINIKSVNKEIAGQAAANLERATIIRKRDRRIFQDGIYLITKTWRKAE